MITESYDGAESRKEAQEIRIPSRSLCIQEACNRSLADPNTLARAEGGPAGEYTAVPRCDRGFHGARRVSLVDHPALFDPVLRATRNRRAALQVATVDILEAPSTRCPR